MGMRLFSSSSGDKPSSMFSRWNSASCADKSNKTESSDNLPNPKPDNYKIIEHFQSGKYLLIKIKYLDCTNYEGMKILLFKSTLIALSKQKLIDPHFSENKKFISPLARFEPTQDGWDNAIKFIKILNLK